MVNIIVYIILAFFALSFLGLGIYILARKPVYDAFTTGTISTANCTNNSCIIVVTFTPINATDPITSGQLEIDGSYKTGDTVKISYDSTSPNTFGINQIKPAVFGWSFTSIGIFLVLIICALYYLNRKPSEYVKSDRESAPEYRPEPQPEAEQINKYEPKVPLESEDEYENPFNQ